MIADSDENTTSILNHGGVENETWPWQVSIMSHVKLYRPFQDP